VKLFPIIGCVISIAAPIETAWGASIINGDFSTGDFTGWTCPASDCSTLNNDPYWMHVDNTHPAPGERYSAHIGAWDVNNPGYIEQSNLSTSQSTGYILTFLYGEFNDYDPYAADPSLPQTNEIDVYWNGARVYSDSNFFLAPSTHAGDGFFTTVSVNVTSSTIANSDDLRITADDVLQDVILTDISIAEGTTGALAPLAITRQVVNGEWADTQVAGTPEPGTLGLMGISCALLFLTATKAGPARRWSGKRIETYLARR
jgi:hypothetical protein